MRNAETPWIVGKIPLYEQPSVKVGTGHAGLYFDKFCRVLDPEKAGDKAVWLKEFVEMAPRVGEADLIAEFVARRVKLIEQFHGAPVRMTTVDRFVTGLGVRHALENGFAWHAVLGTPYLAGSGLKGLARAWAVMNAGDTDEIKRIFGPRGEKIEHQAGTVIFLEAIPTAPVKLVAEVMTPHYGPYYRGEKPPADYHDPVPIPFLAVEKGARFFAGVLPRTPSNVKDAQRARKWLMEALEQLGAGAKTATGYGRFNVEKDATEDKKSATKDAVPQKKVEMAKAAEPTRLPAFFEVEFVNFGEAREARKAARDRVKKGKEAKFREFDLRPMDRTLTNLVGKLVCSSVDTEGYDLPFEAADRNAGVPEPFYVGNLEEREGKKIARLFSLTPPTEARKMPR